ncbi:MAG: hypothetical protein E4H28_07540, partial [Gemmatimonadales bacterium]
MADTTGKQRGAKPSDAERFHMLAARPIVRSITWDPVPTVTPPEMEGAYDVFIMQSALEDVLEHVWGASANEAPFGLLAGDICEDPEDGTRFVQICGACPSRLPMVDGRIPPEAWEALSEDLEARGVPGSLVGWYVRHSDGAITLTPDERASHSKYFSEPWHSLIIVTNDEEDPKGGFFRSTARGFSTVALPFHEVVTAGLMARRDRHTLIDWTNAETSVEATVQTFNKSGVDAGATVSAGRTGKHESSTLAGPIAQEAARRAIAAAASKTAADLD